MPSSAPRLINADITIVGAGIVGLTFALQMAQTGVSIVIIDRGEISTVPNNNGISENVFSPRVSAISSASDAAFRKLGVWQKIARMQSYDHMQVWDKDNFGEISFSAKDLRLEYLGHIIENSMLESALYAQIQNYNNIELIQNTTLNDIRQEQEHSYLTCNATRSGTLEIKSQLTIGADGAHSAVKTRLKLPETFWDYEHIAIVTTVATELPHQSVARQVFTPFGPLAFLPLPDAHQVSIVWSQQNTKAAQLLSLGENAFCKTLYAEIDGAYGKLELRDQRYSFPLKMRYSRQWVNGKVVLAGDAAHTIHPLAGQGANLGIADVCALSSILIAALDKGEKVNSAKRLREYERWRKAEAIKTIATMEAFKRGFEGNRAFKKLVRGLALLTANRVQPIKAFFIHQASGQ